MSRDVCVCVCICISSPEYILDFDPQPDVPRGMNPMAQCAFEILVLNVSAIRTSYRS